MLPLIAVCVLAADPAPVEFAGMKATPPAGWKPKDKPDQMRTAQFVVPKADGDAADADVSLFEFSTPSGSQRENLTRQLNRFKEAGRTEKLSKVSVGPIEATYQDISGTYLKRPFPASPNVTEMPDYRQLYALFEKDGKQYYVWLVGPKATVEKHRKGFEVWLKSFK